MFEKILIGAGLILIPFYSTPGDTRTPKLMLALGFALALSLWVFFKGKMKSINNKWLYILIGYLFLSIQFAPQFKIPIIGTDVMNFWVWQPFTMMLVFFLMLHALVSIELDINLYLKIISWVGLIMASYGILQFFGIEQFYILSSRPDNIHVPSCRLTGALGQPTLLASFIAMIIPICLYLRRYLFAIIIGIAVILTKSQVAIGAMAVSCLFLLAFNGKKWAISIGIGVLVFSILFCVGWTGNVKFIQNRSSGRFLVWKNTISDLITPLVKDNPRKYPFTGLGLGSYQYLHTVKYNDNFRSAHNEYIQFGNETGIIGFALLLCTMCVFIWNAFKERVIRYKKYLLASFICSALCAGGNFVWHLGAHIYYTIFILGLMINNNIKTEREI